MGYGYYILPDGREAGYGVTATCDVIGCEAEIDRGLAYLCGNAPDGHRDSEEFGCGLYFCLDHLDDHECSWPECEDCAYHTLAAGHEGPHHP